MTTWEHNYYKEFDPGWSRTLDGGWTVNCVRYPGTDKLGHVYKAETGRWVITELPHKGTFRTREDAARAEWEHVAGLWADYERAKQEPEIVDAEVIEDEDVCGVARNGTTCTEPKRHKGVHRADKRDEAGAVLGRHYWGRV